MYSSKHYNFKKYVMVSKDRGAECTWDF